MSVVLASNSVVAASIAKAPSANFSAVVSFKHKGKSEDIIVGVGLSYLKEFLIFPWLGHNEPFVWAMEAYQVDEDGEWTDYAVTVSGVIPADAGTNPNLIEEILNLFLGGGVKLDAYSYVAKASSPEDAESDSWDDDVYILSGSGGVVGGILDILPLMIMMIMMGVMMPMMQPGQSK